MPPIVVPDAVLKYPLEQQRKLRRRLCRVLLRQLEHGVLHQVESQMLVADRENRLFESPALDFGEEGRELFFCRQRKVPGWFLAREGRQQAGC